MKIIKIYLEHPMFLNLFYFVCGVIPTTMTIPAEKLQLLHAKIHSKTNTSIAYQVLLQNSDFPKFILSVATHI